MGDRVQVIGLEEPVTRGCAAATPVYCGWMPPDDAVLLIFAVLFGLVFGSFLNVCIVRLPRGASIAWPGSHCFACGHAVRRRDNVPVLSWLLLRGRCRDCGAGISIRYPLVEGGTAVLFAACLMRFGPSVTAAGMAMFCWLLLGLLLMDAETLLLPDAFTLPGIALGFGYNALTAVRASGGLEQSLRGGLEQSLLGASGIGGFLWLVRSVYRLVRRREGMGFGDVKLGAMLGAWLGWKMGAVTLFIAIVTGAVAGMALAFRQRRSAGRGISAGSLRVPLGTFLAGAGMLTVFVGAPLLHWYLGFFPR